MYLGNAMVICQVYKGFLYIPVRIVFGCYTLFPIYIRTVEVSAEQDMLRFTGVQFVKPIIELV